MVMTPTKLHRSSGGPRRFRGRQIDSLNQVGRVAASDENYFSNVVHDGRRIFTVSRPALGSLNPLTAVAAVKILKEEARSQRTRHKHGIIRIDVQTTEQR